MNDKKFLLKEFTAFEYNDLDLDKREEGKPLVLNGILQKANTLNQNGRVYPRHILEREIRNYEKLIREIWMEGDVVYGKVEILDTPCGKIIESIIKAKCKPGISSRALGSLQRENNVNVVQDDLQIICWDFVSEPSTPGAFMMAEAKQYDEKTLRQVFSKSDLVDRAVNEILALKTKK